MTNLSLEYFDNGIRVYQDNNLYKFTSDAVKLAKFCKFKSSDFVLDMCAGCGVVGLCAYGQQPCSKIYFNEIQQPLCKLIEKNVDLNALNKKAEVINKDLNELNILDFDKKLDVIICNPPYFKVNGKIKENENLAICRHEIRTNLQQIVSKAGTLIKHKGRFYLILPSSRMCECVILLNQHGFEVKNMKMYQSKNISTVVLLEAVKNGKSGVAIQIDVE